MAAKKIPVSISHQKIPISDLFKAAFINPIPFQGISLKCRQTNLSSLKIL